MTVGPSWLTDPEYDVDPPSSDWWRDREVTFDTPVSECDHPDEQVMTTENGLVVCHSCGLAVGKRPIVSDAYHGRRRPGSFVNGGSTPLTYEQAMQAMTSAAAIDSAELRRQLGIVTFDGDDFEGRRPMVVPAWTPDEIRSQIGAHRLAPPSLAGTLSPLPSYLRPGPPSWLSVDPSPSRALTRWEAEQPPEFRAYRPPPVVIDLPGLFAAVRQTMEDAALQMALWGEAFIECFRSIEWSTIVEVGALVEQVRLDAELAALPRNTRREIDGVKCRIAGRPGNRHWREVAPARYRGAKR